MWTLPIISSNGLHCILHPLFSQVKCEKYWDVGTKHFDNINVTMTSEIPLEDWTIRDFKIRNVSVDFVSPGSGKAWSAGHALTVLTRAPVFILQVKTAETRSVRQFHFTAWPDHGVPETTELLIGFRHLVREHMDQYSKHSPTVVHCRSGNNAQPPNETFCWNCLKVKRLLGFFSIMFTQRWGRTHGNLHSHRPAHLPDREGEYCGRVRHCSWSANAPATHGADGGRREKRRFDSEVLVFHFITFFGFCFSASAGPVRVLEPVCDGHYQIKNRNQRGSDLPKHGCSLHLRERWAQERLARSG